MDSGVPVTVAFVDGLIGELAPGVQKLAPGVKEKDLKVAVEYLKGQIRKEWASDFLTSDLMPYLAIADGVPAKWQKAGL
jgi:malate synthase